MTGEVTDLQMIRGTRSVLDLVAGKWSIDVLYLLANLAYLRVLGQPGLAASDAPAADLMRRVIGPGGGALIAAGIAVSTFGFLNLVILVTPRVLQAMAADGVFVSRLATLHPRYRTPSGAIMLQGVWAIVLALTGTFAQLVDYVSFGDWIFFGLTVAGLARIRAADAAAPAAAPRGLLVPGYPWTPAFFVLAALLVVVSSVLESPRNAAIGTGLLVLGVPVFRWWARGRPAPARDMAGSA